MQLRLTWCLGPDATLGTKQGDSTMNETMNETVSNAMNKRVGKTMETLCRRCRFHPASPRIAGYCSWDCYDADDEAEEEGEKAA